MRKTILKSCYLFAMVTALFFTTTGCSSDSPDIINPGIETNNYKYTITINNPVEANDNISFILVAGAIGNDNDIWKVNGVTRTGERSIGLSRNDFNTGTNTYVIESLQPLRLNAFSVQLINYDADLTYAIKIEVNNEVKLNEAGTLSGNGKDFTRQYNF